MADRQAEPKLLFPQLLSFYDRVIPLSWPIIRVACGFLLMMHGWPKLYRGPSSMLPAFNELGFNSVLWIWADMFIEFFGGISIMLGLFTRFWAAAAAIELLIITMVYVPNGFGWLKRGYEFTLLWGLICFAIALRGGGPYSLDRKIGKEL